MKFENMLRDTVFVTDPSLVLPRRSNWRYAKAAHLWSADSEALEKFAKQLKLNKSWKHYDHYDVTENKRWRAINLGAVPITERDLVTLRKTEEQRSKT